MWMLSKGQSKSVRCTLSDHTACRSKRERFSFVPIVTQFFNKKCDGFAAKHKRPAERLRGMNLAAFRKAKNRCFGKRQRYRRLCDPLVHHFFLADFAEMTVISSLLHDND